MKVRVCAGTLADMPGASLFAAQAWVRLASNGLTDGALQMSPTDECVFVMVAPNGRDFVEAGVMTFAHEATMARLWINLSFVAEEYRGKGVYRMMYGAVQELAHQRRCRTIESAVHENNQSMRQVARRLGRREKFVIVVEELEHQPIDITPDAG